MTALSTSLSDSIEYHSNSASEKCEEEQDVINGSDGDSYEECCWSDCGSVEFDLNWSELQYGMTCITEGITKFKGAQGGTDDTLNSSKYSWFGCEDVEQVRTIIEIYEENLGVCKQRSLCVRSARPFIGRVCRQKLSELPLTTFDKVEVFYNDFIPEGTTYPRGDELTVLTCWNENGLPSKMRILSNSCEINNLQSNLLKSDKFYLYCIPCNTGGFEYVSSDEFSNVVFCRESFSFASLIPRGMSCDSVNNTFWCFPK